MQLVCILAALAATLLPVASARLVVGEELCYTFFDTTSIKKVPTSTITTTASFTFTATRRTVPVTTVTPTAVQSATVTTSSTYTLPQLTDTFTSTATSTSTGTSVVTATNTLSTEVTTTITLTTPVTASVAAGFTPFASEAAVIAAGGASPNNVKAKKREDSLSGPRRALASLQKRDGFDKVCPPGRPKLYPSRVECAVIYETLVVTTVTVAAGKTKTRTAPTVTTTSTQTVGTVLTVVPPDASTTVVVDTTVSTTITTTSTISTTETTTDTATAFVPSGTFYPQCQSDNLVASVGGNNLYFLEVPNPQYNPGLDPVSCCELCQNTAGCAGFSGASGGYTDCYLFLQTGSTCDPSVSAWTVYNANGQTTDLDIVGNGNCGQGTYGGSV